jgi:hypothetical protein
MADLPGEGSVVRLGRVQLGTGLAAGTPILAPLHREVWRCTNQNPDVGSTGYRC